MDVVTTFVVGPQRAGTTLIYEMLRTAGPGIFVNRLEKEDFYFHANTQPDRATWENKQWGQGAPQAVVDVNPIYFGHGETIDAILATVPDARFVYVHRDEDARRSSYEQHQRLNAYAKRILGYCVSDELYQQQADFEAGEQQLRERIDPERLLRLEFSDLEADGGKQWRHELGQFLGVPQDLPDVGRINTARRHDLWTHRVLFAAVRVVQLSRVHIWIRRARLSRVRPPMHRLRAARTVLPC